ncbi:MAG: glycerol-3-phosphate acyltransferase [Acidimicrobiales bacterium]
MSVPRSIAAVGAAYLIGTLPSADIVTRLATKGRVDIRSAGTGNPGAANVAGVVGKKWGAVVMAADVAKGLVACRLGGRLAGGPGMHVAGPVAVAGHCYPAWDGFEGGKGVATSSGQVLATFPIYFPIDAAVAAVVSRLPMLRRRAFAATEVASAAWVASALLWWRCGLPNPAGAAPGPGLAIAALATSAIIRVRFEQTEAKVEAWRRQQDAGDQRTERDANAGERA